MDFKKAQAKLVSNIKLYNNSADIDKVIKAFNFGMDAHIGQTRSNGDPYFSHCVEVAEILVEKHMDTDTIVTALLHDTVEDTDVTSDDIIENFGSEVANLVQGVTKLEVIEFRNDQAKQAENFRKLLLAMSEDIRVLLIKLADRLHNIRTLHFINKPEKQLRISMETMDIYVPLAERIGIRDWKEELEDICFIYINPGARSSIIKRLDYLSVSRGEPVVDKVIEELKQLFVEHSINSNITGRRKTPYSIWKKMQKKDVGFEQLSDVMAFRVVVDSVEDCYKVLGLIHGTYKMVPGRFKDYISLPKTNGYKSLHTGVIGPAKQRIEIQVRTTEMHSQSELGVAAHWNYKASGENKDAIKEGKNYRWIRELLEILETTNEANDFWDDTRMEMYADQVFTFSPKGDIVNLPKGACCIDFAYAIHSKVGDKTIGAKINGKIMPLKTILQNGDQVDILTQNNAEPKASWESLVVSGKARSAIRRFIRIKNRDEFIENGKLLLGKTFKQAGFDLRDKDISYLAEQYNVDVDSYLVSIGDGTKGVNEALYKIYPEAKAKKKEILPVLDKTNMATKNKVALINGIIPDMVVRFSKCCHAIPGDRIVGIVHTGQGVSIHNLDCKEIKQYEEFHNQWLDVSWKDDGDEKLVFVSRINILFNNTQGTLSEITTNIANNRVNIVDLKVINRSSDFWDINVDLEVPSVSRLMEVIANIRILKNVSTVTRL